MMKKKNKIIIILSVIFSVLFIFFISCVIYVNIYYKADKYAQSQLCSTEEITYIDNDDYYAFTPKTCDTGIIFYPGGKVEETAYAPLMKALANENILTIVAKMPFRLAVFDSNAATGIKKDFDNIKYWYMSGHSLGGAMAASHVNNHPDEYTGLILLGAYSTKDLSELPLNVISIYGQYDQILNKEKYDKNLKNLPLDYKEYIIKGGNHSYFGNYGIQSKDNKGTITNEQQINLTVEFICENIVLSRTVKYKESIDTFDNPDCGFYQPVYIKCDVNGSSSIPDRYLTYNNLLHLRIDISCFSKKTNNEADMLISQSALNALEEEFKKIQKSSATAIVRFAYDQFDGEKNMEPSIDMMKEHIKQFTSLINQYHKIITAVEFGLVGPWGEMHSSDIANQDTYNQLIDVYLDSTSDEIAILLRRPKFVYQYYGYTLQTLDTYNVSNQRLGVYNDGYLGSATDLGTYDDREKEINWLSKINEILPYGGEVTVPDSQYNRLNNSVTEMFDTNLSYLNESWNDTVVNRWKETTYTGDDLLYKDSSEFTYIQNHLGYRLVLRNLIYSFNNDNLNLSVNIENVGFGNLIKEKNIYIILKNEENIYVFNINQFSTYNFECTIDLSEIKNGEYEVYLSIADCDDHNMLSIRFGNENMWDEDIHSNKLNIKINKD